jgi:hypothetical protein
MNTIIVNDFSNEEIKKRVLERVIKIENRNDIGYTLHVINLTIQECIKQIDSLIDEARKIEEEPDFNNKMWTNSDYLIEKISLIKKSTEFLECDNV